MVLVVLVVLATVAAMPAAGAGGATPVASSALTASSEGTGDLVVTVLSGPHPAAGVVVEIAGDDDPWHGSWAVTGADGRATFTGVPAGTYRVQADDTASGSPVEVVTYVTADATTEITVHITYLAPGGFLYVTVVDESDQPMAGVVVTAIRTTGWAEESLTEDDGVASFVNIPDGSYTVWVLHPEHGGYTTVPAVVTEGENTFVTVRLAGGDESPQLPGPPTSVAAAAGAGQAEVSWVAPEDDGGSPITGFVVTALPTGATVEVGPTATDVVVGGLANGRPVTFTVRAVNAVGAGPASAASAPVIPMPTACDAAAFGDIGEDHPFCTEISWFAASGITTGYPDGTFRAGDILNRMQLAVFLYRHAGSPWGADPTCEGAAGPFTDVRVDHPFCGEITWLAHTGITTGYTDGTFRPTHAVSRLSGAVLLHRHLGSPAGSDPTCTSQDAPFVDVPADHPFCGAVQWLADLGITTGYPDATFRPSIPLRRQSAAVFFYRATARLGLPEPD